MHGQLPIHQAIENNDKKVLELINKATSDNVNATNKLGQTPLHLAIATKHLGGLYNSSRDEVINALIAKGADVNAKDQDGETPVHYIERWLLNNGSDEKVRSQVYHNYSREWLDKKLISSLKCLTAGGTDVNIEDNKGNTALDYILNSEELNLYQAMNTIEFLLEAGARIKNAEHALKVINASILYSKDSLEMVKLVISKSKIPFNTNYKDKKGNTALSSAYKKKKFDVIKYLIENGANPNTIIPSTSKNFITHVVEENLFDLVPSLKFDTILINGFTPLIIAINSGNYNSFKTLIENHQADVNFSDKFGKKPIHYVAAGGSTEIVEYLLNHGADIKDLDKNGNTALHYAANNKDGNTNISFLIEKGVNVNCENSSGERPIHYAIESNNLNNFKILLDKGATLEMKDFAGVKDINPLFVIVALMRNHPVTEALLKDKRVQLNDVLEFQYDYDPNEKENLGTILHWAAKNNRLDIIDILKPYIKSQHLNYENQYGDIPLCLAIYLNNIEVVKSLLQIPDININILDKWSNHPIEYAQNAKMVLLLVNAGADIESKEGKHSLASVMIGFAEKGDATSLEKLLSDKLLKDKIDVNASTEIMKYNGALTMLEVAAWQGDIEMLKMLSKYGADVNLKSTSQYREGTVILYHVANKYSNIKDQAEKNNIKDVMTLLVLLFDADLTLTDNKGKAPLDYLKDTNVKQELENVKKLRNNINEIGGTNTTDFILHYLEQNRGKSIESCLKGLDNNFDKLMNKYASRRKGVNEPSASLDDVEVKKNEKDDKSCTIMQ